MDYHETLLLNITYNRKTKQNHSHTTTQCLNTCITMTGGHTVHKRQAILSTPVIISDILCIENEKELSPRGAWQ